MINDDKVRRRKEILHIINEEKKSIASQQELVIELKHRGFNVVQSTISRDLKALNIDRESAVNPSYHMLKKINKNSSMQKMINVYRGVIVDMITDEKLICIKTLHGMAPTVAEMIDCINDSRIAGTIAKDSTVLTLCRSNEGCKQIKSMLVHLLDNKNN